MQATPVGTGTASICADAGEAKMAKSKNKIIAGNFCVYMIAGILLNVNSSMKTKTRIHKKRIGRRRFAANTWTRFETRDINLVLSVVLLLSISLYSHELHNPGQATENKLTFRARFRSTFAPKIIQQFNKLLAATQANKRK